MPDVAAPRARLRLCKSSRPGPVRRTARPPVVYVGPMPDTTLRAFGWKPLLIHGDPCVLDRWLWLRRHLRRGRVRTFDAGCGNGAFSIYAARCGNDVLAASFSPREREEHRESLGRFDQIICFETIEHLSDDEGLVRSLGARASPRAISRVPR